METENDLPEVEIPETSTGLFTDDGGGDGAPMLPDVGGDGAPAAESIETKAGKTMLRLKMPNGHVYTGETEKDLLEQVFKGKVEADKVIADRESQIRELRGNQRHAAEGVPGARPAPASAAPIPAGEYSDQTYLDLLGKDTIAARRYQDKHMYGDVDPVAATSYSYKISAAVEQQLMAAEFMRRNPDYVPTKENADQLTQAMQAARLEPNVVNMEWAYGDMKRNGLLAPNPETDGFQYQDVTFGGNAPNPQPQPKPRSRGASGVPPAPSRGGSPAAPSGMDFESMTLAELTKAAEKLGAFRR